MDSDLENQMAWGAYTLMQHSIKAEPTSEDFKNLENAARVIGEVRADPGIKQAFALEMRMRMQLVYEHGHRHTRETVPA